MKSHKFILVLPALLALQTAFAQSSKLTLSDNYPAASEKIKITYNPAGTPVEGKKDISAEVFYIDGKDYPAVDVDLKKDGSVLTGNFTIPATAKAFFVKIFSDDVIDNNNDKGYVFLVYKGEEPIQGAYESKGFILTSGVGSYMAKIKTDKDEGFAMFKKESELYPQSEKLYQANYYRLLAGEKDPASIDFVNKEITSLEKSEKEKDVMMAADLLKWTKQPAASDSLLAILRKRFPGGESVKNIAHIAVLREKDIDKKDSLYQAFIAKYPEKADDKEAGLDYMRAQLASGYLKKGNMEAYEKYAAQVKEKSGLAMGINNVAFEWAQKGEKLDEAEKLSRQSLDFVQESIKKPVARPYTSLKSAVKNSQSSYDMYADTYAFILYKEGKYAEALKYQQGVYDHNTSNNTETNEHYVLILNALGKYAASKQVIQNAIKDNKGSAVLKDELKKAYVGLNKNETGYDQYLASLTAIAKKKSLEELIKQMISQPALPFALKDLDGNTVSLASLKGKTIIVDFWATWCGPCKASFPGMQMAVNKYKDDPNVKFLFIDTWENGDNYVDGVKKFITDNKYTFNVLLDEKGSDGKQSKVVSQFEVSGIPTKFIIDKNGIVRFKKVGFMGSPDDLVNEVSSMIELANGSELVQVTGK
ncbi:MAG: resA 6 [Mucilaginibacter sp.]|nr:resA 6 [Mucilaginibacter sp.]